LFWSFHRYRFVGYKGEPVQISAFAQPSTTTAQLRDIEFHRLRLRTVTELSGSLSKSTAEGIIQSILTDCKQSSAAHNPRVEALIADLEGQVSEAFSKREYLEKWGKRFIPSLLRTHSLQQCNNFKDPGVQIYGGALFQQVRDEADDIFCKLPPPKPAKKIAGRQAPRSMAVYHNVCGGCIAPQCTVSMADGSTKLVSEVKAGDLVQSSLKGPKGPGAKVVCVTKSETKNGVTPLVRLAGGVLLTPYHPVRMGGKWSFPVDLAPCTERAVKYVYNFVLDTDDIMVVNGVECVTLGHSFQEDTVRHPYFGTQKVVDDLKTLPGWGQGLVTLGPNAFKRDPKTMLLQGIVKTRNATDDRQ
jgi:hypothetical protein